MQEVCTSYLVQMPIAELCRVKMPIAELCQVKIPIAKLCRVFNSEFYSAFLLETRKQHKHTRTTHTHIHDALKLNQRRWQTLSMFYYTHSNVWIDAANLGKQGSHWKKQNSFKCFRENFVEVHSYKNIIKPVSLEK